MIFDKALRKRSGAVQKSAGSAMLTLESPKGWPGWTAEDEVAMSRDKAMKLSTVSRCVELRANAIAMLPVYLLDENTKARPKDHPLGPLLWGPPNEMMSRYDYERLMQCNLDLCGNAYAWINRDSRTGRPVELIPLRPDDVTPYITPNGLLTYIYTDPGTGEMTSLDPADVLHYKAYSTDGITGISILRRASQAISTGLSAQSYQGDLYANGGQPSGALLADTDIGGTVTVKNADGQDETIAKTERIRREWEKIHSGPGKKFRIAVLPRGVTYTPIGMKNSDAQFVESEEYRVADVARFFGVPLYLLNAGKQAYRSNEQNSIDFVKHTMLPIIVQREQEDTWKLLLPRDRGSGLRVKREPKQLLRGDTAAQIAWYKGMRDIGAYSVDDVLGLEDLPCVPGGDSRSARLDSVPLEDWRELSRLRALQGQENTSEE